MTQKLTGPEMIQFFSDCCEKSDRLFIPDLIRQDAVAESLVKHYDADVLKASIEAFISSNAGPHTVFDFALASRSYASKAEFELKSVNNFKAIVEETRKRIEG